jgi:hypothetical protein
MTNFVVMKNFSVSFYFDFSLYKNVWEAPHPVFECLVDGVGAHGLWDAAWC